MEICQTTSTKSRAKHGARTVTGSFAALTLCAAVAASAQTSPATETSSSVRVTGIVQADAAYTVTDPTHWSVLRLRADLSLAGKLGSSAKFKFTGRAESNVAANVEDDFYPRAVRDDLRFDAVVREAYVDVPVGEFGLRVGRQFINWGEAVGVFVADVVNARDLREFFVNDVDQTRIGQWAVRADWQGDDKHAEVVWVPYPSYDRIGFPGSEFYPLNVAALNGAGAQFPVVVTDFSRPSRKFKNGNYGIRGGFLYEGFDFAAFHYSSLDSNVVFARDVTTSGALVLTPRAGNRIAQTGLTVSKDVQFAVLKMESVLTTGREYATLSSTAPHDLVERRALDWLIGADIPIPDSEARLNAQLIQRVILNHVPELFDRKRMTMATLQFVYPMNNWEFSILGVANVERSDWLIRPKISYKWTKNTRVSFGADVFGGEATGLLGQYDARDRVYVQVRHAF